MPSALLTSTRFAARRCFQGRGELLPTTSGLVDGLMFPSDEFTQAWLGKQNIVWGKTELFRTTDQFNPLDLGLSTLPSLEEARIPLLALRGVYSFYDVGPLADLRVELKNIQAHSGATLLYVTHSSSFAELADEVWEIHSGELSTPSCNDNG